MSDDGTATDHLLRIAATIDRERDASSLTCARCGGPSRVVVGEEPAGSGPPVIRVHKECALQGCERP